MRRERQSNWGRFLIALAVIFLLVGIGGYAYFQSLFSAPDSNAVPVAFVIREGETTADIVSKLKEKGLIKSEFAFKWALRDSGKADKILPGDYKLSASDSAQKMVETLTSGPVEKWVTFPEGWRVEQMAERLNAQLGLDKTEFLNNAKEGYMFPDTYLFSPEATPADIALRLQNTFKQKYTAELQDRIRAKGLTAEQGVILASLVEQEARSDKVRTEVASIMLKRLKMGMKLDIDATVRYALDSADYKRNGKVEKYWQAIRQADYSGVESPYNTYLNNGLPPAPICNPSLSSLNAVANADPKTPYLFYFHNVKGETYYAETLDEHNENVANHR